MRFVFNVTAPVGRLKSYLSVDQHVKSSPSTVTHNAFLHHLDTRGAITGERAFIKINKALVATLLSADNLYKQFGSRSELTEHQS